MGRPRQEHRAGRLQEILHTRIARREVLPLLRRAGAATAAAAAQPAADA